MKRRTQNPSKSLKNPLLRQKDDNIPQVRYVSPVVPTPSRFLLLFAFFFLFVLYYKFILHITRGVPNKAVEKKINVYLTLIYIHIYLAINDIALK